MESQDALSVVSRCQGVPETMVKARLRAAAQPPNVQEHAVTAPAWAPEAAMAVADARQGSVDFARPRATWGISAEGIAYIKRLAAVVDDERSALPELAREMCRIILTQIARLNEEITALQKRIASLARESRTAQRLQTMPGVEPIGAFAVEAFAPEMTEFRYRRCS